MPFTDELQALASLHAEGALSDAEFAAAKARLLSGPKTFGEALVGAVPDSGRQFDQLHRDALIAQLDREWALEREKYLTTDRYGARSGPPGDGGMLGGVIFAAFMLCWTTFTAQSHAPALFTIFGVFGIIAGIGATINAAMKATAYRDAEEAYEQRRTALIDPADLPR